MATVADTILVELGLDPRKLIDSLKAIDVEFKKSYESQRRQIGDHEGHLEKLGLLLTRVAGGFTTLVVAAAEAALAIAALSKPLSEAGTHLANVAEVAGVGVTSLDTWRIALQSVGGSPDTANQAFTFQSGEITKQHLNQPMSQGLLQAFQQLGLNPNSYYDSTTGVVDVERLNLDILRAINRPNRSTGRNYSASERADILGAFGWKDPASQRLFRNDGEARLAAAQRYAMTEQNAAAFREVNEAWVGMMASIRAAGNDLITYFKDPLVWIFNTIKDIVEYVRNHNPLNILKGTPGVEHPATSATIDWLRRHGFYTPEGHPDPGFTLPFGGESAPAAPAPAPSPGGAQAAPLTAPPTPAPAVPPPTTFEKRWPAPGEFAPKTAPNENPGNFDERFNSAFPGQHSSLDPFLGLTNTGHRAAGAASAAGNSSTVTHNSSVTVGSMSFAGGHDDTSITHAPAGVAKDLSVGSFAPHFNESYE